MIDAMSSSLFLEIISVKRASSFLCTQKINEKKIHNNFRSINRMNYSQNCWKLNYVHTCNMKLYQNPENYRSGPISLDPAQYFPILPDITRSCSILPDPARYHSILLDFARIFPYWPEVRDFQVSSKIVYSWYTIYKCNIFKNYLYAICSI